MSQVKGTKMTKEKHELYPFDLAQFSAPNTSGGCEIIDATKRAFILESITEGAR